MHVGYACLQGAVVLFLCIGKTLRYIILAYGNGTKHRLVALNKWIQSVWGTNSVC
nr:hypothetical protein SYMBAF_90279 [Serratia symbiotica]